MIEMVLQQFMSDSQQISSSQVSDSYPVRIVHFVSDGV
jgi:hypothetical protein